MPAGKGKPGLCLMGFFPLHSATTCDERIVNEDGLCNELWPSDGHEGQGNKRLSSERMLPRTKSQVPLFRFSHYYFLDHFQQKFYAIKRTK